MAQKYDYIYFAAGFHPENLQGATLDDLKIIEKFAYEKFGTMSGYAQQYLFHYGRENGLGK